MIRKMKNKYYILCLSLIPLLLSSCGIYGSYQRPEEITAERLFRAPTLPNDTVPATDQNIATLSWQDFFSDPQLKGLIKTALERNADIRIAQLGLEQSKAALLSAKLGFLPNISAAPSGQYSYNTEVWSYNLPITASWEVDLFGKLRNSLEQQKAQTRLAEAQTYLIQTNIIAAVANSYYTLLALDAQIGVAEKTVATWRENIRVLRLLKETGRVTEAAIAQAEAQTFGLLDVLAELKTQRRVTENALATLLHLPPQQIERGSMDSERIPHFDTDLGVPVDLLALRPDVQMAEERLVMAYYGANRARADFLPSIKLTANGTWTNALGGVIVDPFTFVGNAISSLFQPIFNNGRYVAQLRIAKAKQKEATIQFQQTLIAAGAEVSNQLYRIEAYRTKIDFRKKQLESLHQATDMTMKLMTLGNGTYLEVLTSQQQLLNAEMGSYADQLGLLQAHINLYKALGGGTR